MPGRLLSSETRFVLGGKTPDPIGFELASDLENESFPLQINFLLTLQLQMIAFGEEVLIQVMRDFLWVIDDAQRSGIDLFDEEEFASLQFFPLDFHSKEFLLQIGERRSFRSLFDLHRSPVVEDRRKHFEHQLKVF